MKIVLWRLAHDSLPTGQQLSHRHIPASDACCYCGQVVTVAHAILKCQYVTEIWREMKNWCGIKRKIKSFVSPKQWLFDYLASASDEEAISFTIMMWHIWENRNAIRNGENIMHPHRIAEKSKAYIQMFLLSDNAPNVSNRCESNAFSQKWVPPPEDWVKANVDAAIFADSGKMGLGCVIRDHNGRFLAATSQGIERITEPELAEALAVHCALKFIFDQHWKKVIIASDCLNLVRKLRLKGMDRSHVGAIVQDIKKMAANLEELSFVYNNRYCNQAAHILARSANQTASSSVWSNEVPESIRTLLCNELLNELM